MRGLLALSIIAAAGVAAWGIARRRDLASSAPASPAEPASWAAPPAEADPLTSALYAVEDLVTDWKAKGAKYASIIAAAATRHGVPPDLLMRVAYQESRFREDIITGKTRSSAGAVGMFQFMPATARDLGVDPLNVTSAADGAARYLRQLYRQFGSWSWAVAAYNGGPGNISYFLKNGAWPKRNGSGQIIGTKARPAENVNYVAQIGADVSLA
ncbi:transglycosylase SLT domain-containing protein [Solimonas fluminis]|uniref:transglycosylase SLT domain-containing protein n=1 Tax=Solimonas fluminis TaxID=2086571 RepID=UPI0013FD5C79|nr:transglycosylase SLT domain-containing protein [Solimonas fluminis]